MALLPFPILSQTPILILKIYCFTVLDSPSIKHVKFLVDHLLIFTPNLNLHLVLQQNFNLIFYHRCLKILKSLKAFGPHQFISYDHQNQVFFATTWSLPPHLSAWSIKFNPTSYPQISLINKIPIFAVSSYITSKFNLLFAAGGPTGQVLQLNPKTHQIQSILQQLNFIPQNQLLHHDRSKNALRNGSHAIEISKFNLTFVPDLGHNSIWVYKLNRQASHLDFIYQHKSLHQNDGPRHCVVSEDGKRLYVVTEHTSRVDVYNIHDDQLTLQTSSSILNDLSDPANFRGDTIRVLPSQFLTHQFNNHDLIFATTRGSNSSYLGALSIFDYDLNQKSIKKLIKWETPTSGGKANAIEFNLNPKSKKFGVVELVLTDDEIGYIFILEFNLEKIEITVLDKALIDQPGIGASHAQWIYP
ncbi:hypothetical protein O181_063819 [Austropuccinia psidii MF-1]|uniref:Muconate cycloisomerase 1 n=1 Tax=Austropuccinia psidii MF-1 TaxID=1389203 RepID=A0A9Q3EN65_9BASI|nr:hypothetical protein [Austropuccinia psidii MF-1]